MENHINIGCCSFNKISIFKRKNCDAEKVWPIDKFWLFFNLTTWDSLMVRAWNFVCGRFINFRNRWKNWLYWLLVALIMTYLWKVLEKRDIRWFMKRKSISDCRSVEKLWDKRLRIKVQLAQMNGVEMVKHFVNVRLNCIVATWKGQARFRHCHHPGKIHADAHGCMGALGAWVHGCMGAWVHGFMGSWVHGCVDFDPILGS